ncbi:MAG TPA: hypothetical protein VGE79_12775 [Niastella sp.]
MTRDRLQIAKRGITFAALKSLYKIPVTSLAKANAAFVAPALSSMSAAFYFITKFYKEIICIHNTQSP